MTVFLKIYFTICAIWFLMILFRPRSKEEMENLETIKEYRKKYPYANPSEPLGFWGTIIFWVIFVPLMGIIGGYFVSFIMSFIY